MKINYKISHKKPNLLKVGLLLLLLPIFSILSAQNPSQKVSFKLQNVTIKEFINQIKLKTNFTVVYRDAIIDNKNDISISVVESSLEEVIKEVLSKKGLQAVFNNKTIVITKKKPEPLVIERSKKVSGIVLDENGLPVIGASVLIPGSNIGVATDINGRFTIEAPTNAKLRVSYIGYEPREEELKVNSEMTISLNQSPKSLDEIVVVGFGAQKKESVVGSITSINTKDLVQSPQANISNSLIGRMPGLYAIQNSGEPGNDASILRIRGVGTFTGNQDPLIMVDGIETTNYNNIDPNEIESLTILKDASATAVYGVRGANGVILITTKRGVEGKPKVSFSSNVARTDFPFLRKNMNSYTYANSYNKALAYDSYVTGNYNPKYSDEAIELYRTHTDPIFYPDINWYNYMLKDASYQTQNNLSIRGGTERVKYFISLGYFTQDGMIKTTYYDAGYNNNLNYKRYNIRSNFDINLTKNLSTSIDFSSQISDTRGPNYSTGLLMELLSSVAPNTSPGVINNQIVTIPSITQSTVNPAATLNKGWHQNYENNLNASVRLNYKMDYITKGLSLRGAISYKNYNTDIKTYNQSQVMYQALKVDNTAVFIPNGDPQSMQFSDNVQKNTRTYLEAGTQYTRNFGENKVSGLILYNQSKYYSPDLAYLVPNGYQGLVGRITYAYGDRYLAEYNIGYNGTENFANGKRFGLFPAYSIGWVPTGESFFPKNELITFIKIRGSFGVVGNDKIGGDRFLYLPTSYSYTKNEYYFGQIGSTNQGYSSSDEGKLGNPDLTWEKAKKLNIGIDVKFIQDKVGFTFDYFDENRNNILCNRGTIPVIIGADMPAYNLGIMRNSGYEAEITYNDKIEDFKYFVKGNYTYAHNVIQFQDEVDWPYDYQKRTGQRFGQFFGFVADGLFNTWSEVNEANRPIYMWNNNKIQPGDIKYKDINGDGKIDANDTAPIGYSNFPEVIFGLSLGGNYKGFDFSILFQGASNVSNLPSRRTMRGFYTGTGANADLERSWSQERYEQDLSIVYPRFSVSNSEQNYVTSTYWLEDASYIRLKNAEIGYSFHSNFFKKIGISLLRVYTNGSNLLTWCKLFPGEDPEYPTGVANSEPYPVTRIYNLGFTINF